MTRVEETFAGVTWLSTETPALRNVTKDSKIAKPSPRAWQKRWAVGRVVFGVILLIGLCGGLQTGLAQETPPAITKVDPLVTQPDGIVTLTFSKEVTVSAVQVGNVNASVVSPSATGKTIQIKVATNAPLGRQSITLTATDKEVTDGAAIQITNSIIVAPLVLGLRAHKDAETQLTRGAVAGGEILIKFSGNIPSEIKQGLKVIIGDGEKEAKITDKQDDYLVVQVPETEELRPTKQESYPVRVSVNGQQLEKHPTLRVVPERSMYIWSSVVLFFLIFLIYALYRWFYKVPAGQTRFTFVKMLLLEQENQTYSLSRAQFVGWLIVIIWTYLFLFVAHGIVEKDWSFPNLGNAVYTFMISLGTLVIAQATNRGVGVKGAGVVHPSLADLVVHGGVLALDRVQQLVWTLLALGMFVRNTVETYETATSLPTIPDELLVLMGLSSAGYLGGKLIRGAGPVIEQVTVTEGSVIVTIKGKNLSKEAFIWLDGVQQPKEKVEVIASDPDAPQFAKELKVTLEISMDDWYAKEHALTVINADAQRADWRTGPAIISITTGEPSQNKVPLTIKGAHLVRGATIQIEGDDKFSPKQDETNPNLFTAEVDPEWPNKSQELIMTSNKQKSIYNYTPSASQTGDTQTGGGQEGETQPGERRTGDIQTTADQLGNQAGDDQTGDGQTSDAQTAGAQAADGQTSNTQAGEAQAGEAQTTEGQTADDQASGGQTEDTQEDDDQTGGVTV